jgi:hypothetical protein
MSNVVENNRRDGRGEVSSGPREEQVRDPSLIVQLLLYHAFDYGQRNPITPNSVAFFDEWYKKNADKQPRELCADRSICDMWDHLMERETK